MTAARRSRRLAQAFAVAAILVGASAWPVSAAPAVDPGDLRVDVAAYGPAILQPDSALSLGVTIANEGIVDAAGVTLVLSLTAEPITDRANLAAWASEKWTAPTREVARRLALGTGFVAAQTTVSTTVAADANALGLGAQPWAVYGVTLQVQLGSDDVKVFHTFATYLGGTPSVMPLAIVATAAGAPERVSAVATAASEARTSLLVDPTAAALVAFGPASSFPHDVFSLPAGNIDLASLARAHESTILAAALDASAKADAPSAGTPWLAVLSSLDRESLTVAKEAGAAAVLLQPESSVRAPALTEDPGKIAPALVGTGTGGLSVIAPDFGLSAALAGGKVTEALRPASAVAESALIAMSNPDGHIVVASPGTSWMLDADHHSAALEALAICPWLRLVSLTSVLSDPTTAEAVVPEVAAEAADVSPSQISAAADRLQNLRYLAEATSAPIAVFRVPAAGILSSLSFEGRGDPEARTSAIIRALANAQAVIDKVSLPKGSDLNLISTSGSVPITVTNDLEVEAKVTVVLVTGSYNLRPNGQVSVTLAPGASEQVLIPVTAVSSANVTASVHLTDAAGHRLTRDTLVRVRVRADWGAAFTGVVGGAALLLLIGGIWRTARRGRRDTRGAPEDEPPIGGDG
jgi:hypothetical protein